MKITASAPTRISLFGGGTDLPVFYEKNESYIISMAINLRQHMTIEDHPYQDQYGNLTFPEGADPGFYRTIFNEMGISERQLSLTSTFDGVIKSGLGTSASATVALVGAIKRYKGEVIDRLTVAEQAWDIEVNKIGLYGGKQDQYAASFGGLNFFHFGPDKFGSHTFNRADGEKLTEYILLFYLGFQRRDPKVQERLKILTDEQVKALNQIKLLSESAHGALMCGDFELLGKLLDHAWEEKKRSNSRVSHPEIDVAYWAAKESGAWGGKVCGSGGGGYMVFMVPPEKQASVTNKLVNVGLKPIDFSIDWNGLETRVL